MSYKTKSNSKNRSFSSKSHHIWLPTLIVLLIVGGAAYAIVRHNDSSSSQKLVQTAASTKSQNKINYSSSKPSDNDANNARKSNPSQATQTLDQGSTKTTPANPGNIGITVTNAQTNGSDLEVSTQISGTTNGTCTLTVSQSGQQSITPPSESVGIQSHSNYANCPNFNVPLSQFPNRGTWYAKVTLTSGSSTASSDQVKVNLSS